MAKKTTNKIIKEPVGKDGWSRSEDMVLRNSDYMIEVLIAVLKKVEITELNAAEVYNVHHPKDMETNPWERVINMCNRYVKHLNAKQMAYLKKNNLKIPKSTQNDTKTCVVTPLKQVKTIK